MTEFHQSFTEAALSKSSFLLTGVNNRTPRYLASRTLTSLPRKDRSWSVHADSLRCILRIPESIGSLMGLILFLLPNSIVIRCPMHELTSLVKILAFSLMKILLLRLSQCSGSTPLQKSTSQPRSGGILGTLRCDFPELSPLLGTGMTGSKSTSGISGRTEAEENRSWYP